MLIAFNMYDGTRTNYNANTQEEAHTTIKEAHPHLMGVNIRRGIPMTVERGSNPAIEPTMVYLLTDPPDVDEVVMTVKKKMKTKVEIEIDADGESCGECWRRNGVYCYLFSAFITFNDEDKPIRCEACIMAEPKGDEKK